MLAGARPERGGDLARIGAKAKYSAVPARRARRLVLPIVLGAIVLVAVAILVRASFDTDEPAQDRLGAGAKARSPATGPLPGASQLGVGNPADQSSPPAAALAQPGSVTGVAPSPRAPAPSPASGSAASAAPPGDPAAAASPTGVARPPASPPPGGGPGAPGRAPAARAGAAGSKEPPRGGTAAAHAATSNTPGGAGGAGGPKAGDQKLALADSARREAVWQRPPSSEDSTSRLVARFSASGGATLRGRVVDSETGRPATGVAVEAHIGDSFMRAVSDTAGAFRLSGVLPDRKITVWIVGRTDTFVAERIEVASPGEGETGDAGVVRLLRGDELAAHLEGWMGVFVSRRGHRNVVAAVSPWSPADRAGIQVGDILLSIEGRDVDGLGPRATGFLLRGAVGTKANIAVQGRDGAVHRHQLERVLR